MKKILRAAATSLWLILAVALLLRVGFLYQFQHDHPKQAVSVIPFLFESGNVAHSLATGAGFSSPFRVNTGPTAWMPPIYPLLLAAVFRMKHGGPRSGLACATVTFWSRTSRAPRAASPPSRPSVLQSTSHPSWEAAPSWVGAAAAGA